MFFGFFFPPNGEEKKRSEHKPSTVHLPALFSGVWFWGVFFVFFYLLTPRHPGGCAELSQVKTSDAQRRSVTCSRSHSFNVGPETHRTHRTALLLCQFTSREGPRGTRRKPLPACSVSSRNLEAPHLGQAGPTGGVARDLCKAQQTRSSSHRPCAGPGLVRLDAGSVYKWKS